EQLIKAGATPNGIPDASPPIFFAAANGRQDVVDYLATQGADLYARDTSRPAPRNTVYTAAQETKNPLFIEWIEKRIVETAAKSGKYKCELWLEQDGRRVRRRIPSEACTVPSRRALRRVGRPRRLNRLRAEAGIPAG